MTMLRLVLASQSPRRSHLLREAGYEFIVDPVKVSEIIDENLNPEAMVLSLAQRKAEVALKSPKYLKSEDILILAADTLVISKGRALGKPKNTAEAEQFLVELSGQTHAVSTAICLAVAGGGPAASHVEVSKVTFRTLSAAEIRTYVESGEPMDKAGAYAIQGEASVFVSRLEGSWSNVVGLPLEALESLLKRNGWRIGKNR
jgi:septum formation protein